jgi:hypothetical protein
MTITLKNVPDEIYRTLKPAAKEVAAADGR